MFLSFINIIEFIAGIFSALNTSPLNIPLYFEYHGYQIIAEGEN